MRRWSLAILIATVVGATQAAEPTAQVTTLKIRAQAQVQGDVATLGHVLSFADADPQLQATIAQQSVATGVGPSTVVTYEQIAHRLSELGVNPARVLLTGAAACRLTVTPRPHEETEHEASVVRGWRPSTNGAERTLAQLLREQVDHELGELGGTAELEFDRASAPFLELATPPWDFIVQGRGRNKLGLREFHVVIRRDGKTQRSADVTARVRLSKPVLVARKPLNVGTFVEPDALMPETRLVEREQDLGFDRLEQVVGQRVAQFVPVGQMVRAGDLKAVDMVQRSRPVTVLGASPNVQVRLSGIALDNGGLGETVRVRIGDSRQTQHALSAVVTGLGTVRVQEDRP